MRDVDIEKLADQTDGYTGADIASLSSAAVMLALREHVSKYKDPKEAEKHKEELKIHMKHFEDAMKKIRPLSTQELNMYKIIAEQFGKLELHQKQKDQNYKKDVYLNFYFYGSNKLFTNYHLVIYDLSYFYF